MTNFEIYKKQLRIIDVVEDITRYKCSVEPHVCPVENLCNEQTDCRRLLRAYFEKEAEMSNADEIAYSHHAITGE